MAVPFFAYNGKSDFGKNPDMERYIIAQGILFLQIPDYAIPYLNTDNKRVEGPESRMKRTTMLVLAVTLHNIPEQSCLLWGLCS